MPSQEQLDRLAARKAEHAEQRRQQEAHAEGLLNEASLNLNPLGSTNSGVEADRMVEGFQEHLESVEAEDAGTAERKRERLHQRLQERKKKASEEGDEAALIAVQLDADLIRCEEESAMHHLIGRSYDEVTADEIEAAKYALWVETEELAVGLTEMVTLIITCNLCII